MIFLIETFTWHYYLVIVMQEMQNGGVMIPQLNPLKFKLTQLFTGSKKKQPKLTVNTQDTLYFLKIVNAKLLFLRPVLELHTFASWVYAKNGVDGINKGSQFSWQGSFTNFMVNQQVNKHV